MQQQIINAIAGYLKTYRIDDETFAEQANEIYMLIKPIIEEEKPKWEDAPPWANFLGRDSNGYWYWYENEPDCDKVSGLWVHEGYNYQRHFKQIKNWKETLETRPL